jgi:hypothetical protein
VILDSKKQDVALEIWEITSPEKLVYVPMLKSSTKKLRSFYAEKLGSSKLVKCFADENDARAYCQTKKDQLKLLQTTFSNFEENLTNLFNKDKTKTIIARLYVADSQGTILEIETIWTSDFN